MISAIMFDLAVLVAISWSKSPRAVATNKPRDNQVSFSTNSS